MGSFEVQYEALFSPESVITFGFSFGGRYGRMVIINGVRIIEILKNGEGVFRTGHLLFLFLKV